MMDHWMFSCKDVSLKVSESLDHRLPMFQRLMIRMHLLMCRYCARFHRQILLVREMARYTQPMANTFDTSHTLSPDAQARLKQTLKSASAGS
jgi:hypothetical protein